MRKHKGEGKSEGKEDGERSNSLIKGRAEFEEGKERGVAVHEIV